MKKFLSIFSTVIIVVFLLLALLMSGVRLVGIKPYAVISGSMEPTISIGSLIYTVKVDPAELKIDDIITFVSSDGSIVTHRIYEIVPDSSTPSGFYFITKGDNNVILDVDPTHSNEVIGKVVLIIPHVGYFSRLMQTPPWSFLIIGFFVLIAALALLPDMLDKIKLSDDKTNNTNKDE